jgi:hypothetical protein
MDMGDSNRLMNYKIDETFLLRSPLLPVQVLECISSSTDLESLLKEQFLKQEYQEALYLASPELYRNVLGWLQAGQTTEKVKRKLLQYTIRMSSRCTPFGAFAGVCTASFGDDEDVLLEGPKGHSLHFRPDMQFLCSLASGILSDRKYRESLKYKVNTSLYKTGQEYHYIEYYTDQHGVRRYLLSATLITPVLSEIIYAVSDYESFDSLVAMIGKNAVDEAEAREYLHTLIDNQVLVSNLEPAVSGIGYYDDLYSKIRMNDHENIHVQFFDTICRRIDALNNNRSDDRISVIRALYRDIQTCGLPFSEKTFLQADMRMAYQKCSLSDQTREDLVDSIYILSKFSRHEKNPLLERFKTRFARRYGDMEVPLNLVMDAEAGIAYIPEDNRSGNSPLTEGLELPFQDQAVTELEWSKTDTYLYKLHQEALMEDKYELEINESDLADLPETTHRLPKTISMLVQILGENARDQSKRNMHIKSAGGNSAINLAGRFAYLDHKLEDCLKEMACIEQHHYGDAILAEIVHLPEERTGNVLLRPILRPYEIPYLARASVNPEHCLSLNDLMVSVKDNKVLLRSIKLDRYIIPRLSNAHNYAISRLSAYRFLCDMQSQDVTTNLGFSWGPLENEAYFLPRLSYKNIFLKPAQWKFNSRHLNALKKTIGANEFYKELKKLRKRFHIPGEILLTDYDNELWLDLENKACREILHNEIMRKNILSIREYFHPGKDALVKSPDGNHANEFLFFLYQDPV